MREITVDQAQELYDFLRGKPPEDINPILELPKMNKSQAFYIIWFLQEHLRILHDGFELCCRCHRIYDSYGEGIRDEENDEFYCGSCDPGPDVIPDPV